MKIWRRAVMGYLGGMGYLALELLWRGWTHGSMFIVGGLCFLLIGRAEPLALSRTARAALCAGLITGVEFLSGVLLNLVLGLHVWDYSGMPLHILGQICPLYSIYWFFLSIAAMGLYRTLYNALFSGGRFLPSAGPLLEFYQPPY